MSNNNNLNTSNSINQDSNSIEMEGRVKFYTKIKGYGYIKSLVDKKDYYFKISDVKNFRQPESNSIVTFTPSKNEKGLAAINIYIKAVGSPKNEKIECQNCHEMINPNLEYLDGKLIKSTCPKCKNTINNYVETKESPELKENKSRTLLLTILVILFVIVALSVFLA